MNLQIEPSQIKGEVPAPPSKSYGHRLLLCAALADGESTVTGISGSEDMLATLDCIRALGAQAHQEGDVVTIRGIGTCTRQAHGENLPLFPCRESGSTLRFFIPIALAVCGGGRFTGTPRLMERGVGIYEELFAQRGISVKTGLEELVVQGTLPAGHYQVRGDVSSQFITGLLFALSLLKEDSVIEVLPPVESRAYIDITIDTMRTCGVQVTEKEPNCFAIAGGQSYQPGGRVVEGDWSNAAFLYAFRSIGADLAVRGMNENSIQGDRQCMAFFEQLQQPGAEIDLSGTPDLGPVLFAAAALLHGGTFTGIRRLRIKESDRAAVMAEELEKFGVSCIVEENKMVIPETKVKTPSEILDGHNDHRIVMALSLPASVTGAQIAGTEAVKKSWPEYFEVMKQVGLKINNK